MWGRISQLLFLSTLSLFLQQKKKNEIKLVKKNALPDLHFDKKTRCYMEEGLEAAKAYEELKDVKISFRRKRINSMMAAQPKANFIFRRRSKRSYVIIISNKKALNADAHIEAMGYTARVGIIGHELSHILSYKDMTNWQLILFGLKYFFNKKKIEAETDLMAIRKGFGQHIQEFNNYLFRSAHINKNYLKNKRKYYLSSLEIEQKMQKELYL